MFILTFQVMADVVKSNKYVEVIDLTEENDLKEESSMIMNQFETSKSHQFGHFLIQNQVLKFINYINSSFFFLY